MRIPIFEMLRHQWTKKKATIFNTMLPVIKVETGTIKTKEKKTLSLN